MLKEKIQSIGLMEIKSTLMAHFPIEEKGTLIECQDILIDGGHLYGLFRLTLKDGMRIYSIHEEKIRMIPEYENNFQNRIFKYLKYFREEISKALNQNSLMFEPREPNEVIPRLRRAPKPKKITVNQPTSNDNELPKKSRFVVCGFCGASIAKGSALKKHVEQQHDMPYEIYKNAS